MRTNSVLTPPKPRKPAPTAPAVQPAPAAVAAAPAQPAPKKRAARSASIGELAEAPAISERAVRFEYSNPAAHEVFIAGAFNDWDPANTPMIRSSTGQWSAQIQLKPGAYEYRLVVNGAWQEDPASSQFADNPYGGRNSIVTVND